MASDLKSIERILKVQRQLHDLARSQLDALGRQQRALESEQAGLLTYLSESELMRHEPFVKAAVGRLRALSARQEGLKTDIDRMTKTALHQGRLMKIAERRLADRLRDTRREQERRDQETALEGLIAKRHASLP